MKKYLFLLLPGVAMAGPPSTPFPVFLKSGFSSVLEFEDAPTRVVLGDSQAFQVERLDHSIVIKTLAPYAASNMFVYFKTEPPKLFVLTSSEDAEPTYYRKFESLKPVPGAKPPVRSSLNVANGARVTRTHFDEKKDYLTVEIEVSSDSAQVITPKWQWVRLRTPKATIAPIKLWAERESIQKDAKVRARFIFAKPNVERSLVKTSLVIPITGQASPMTVSLGGKLR